MAATDYGNYSISQATLLRIPQMSGFDIVLTQPTTDQVMMTAPVPDPHSIAPSVGMAKRKRDAFDVTAAPVVKKAAIAPAPIVVPVPPPPPPVIPPPPPPPAVAAVAINDIGIGNCTMLLGQPGAAGTSDVISYYDIGYPLWFFLNTPPANLRINNPGAWAAPIGQNQAGNLQVVLSHWDWDHWRLGHIAGLNGLPWTFPTQAGLGPSANNMIASIPFANRNQIAAGVGPIAGPGGSTIYTCTPAGPGPHAAAVIMNNTGLAISIPMRLPTIDMIPHYYVITGDANFNSIINPIMAQVNNLSGIMAVHHGSNAHGAAAGLPAAVATAGNTGFIGYSYGVSPAGLHSYGFPVAAAVLAYQGAGWGNAGAVNETSTAEGANINAGGMAGRGNIRVGSQALLNAAYNASAFYAIVNPLQ